jgi:hypothetical protein
MNIRAKFWVISIKYISYPSAHPANKACAEVKLAPAYGEENKPWSEATPQGEISMMITNDDAIAAFELGKPYFVDFTPVD